MRRKKQRGQQPAASELRTNLRKTRCINKIELALKAAEEKTSLDTETRLDLSLRFLLTFSLINQWQIQLPTSTKGEHSLPRNLGIKKRGHRIEKKSNHQLGGAWSYIGDLEECAADSNIFFGDQLLIMMIQGELLIGGAQLQQECLINKLSAMDTLYKRQPSLITTLQSSFRTRSWSTTSWNTTSACTCH